MRILGISAFYHDSAAALVEDGRIVAAAQEERFTRRKHDPRFPHEAVDWCLAAAGTDLAGIDHVSFYDKPFPKFERLLETYLAFAPRGRRSFAMALPIWLKEKLFLRYLLEKDLARHGPFAEGDPRLLFAEHHQSHAASAFFPSPFEEAVVLTMDGVGEWATTSVAVGRGHRLVPVKEIRFPHSLGLLYSAFTYYTGFKVNSGEYKLMGLAPYGEPRYRDLILDRLVDLKEDGSFRLDLRYFEYCTGLTMTGRRFHDLFGGPPRHPDQPIEPRHMDLAASIQAVTEEIVLRITRSAHEEAGIPNLCLAGGVALNCVANGKVLRDGRFRDVWVQPASGDAGGALGAALAAWHQHLGQPRAARGRDAMRGALLGPSFAQADCERRLTAVGARFTALAGTGRVAQAVQDLVAGRAVGWFQGPAEFGPRALGGRSILADPRSPDMQRTLNLRIKFRESFRPFAPAIPAERASEWFDLGVESPYMLFVADVSAHRRIPVPDDAERLHGIERLNVPRSQIPAVTHVDGSARVQTVDAGTNPLFHALLTAFGEATGCPVLVNTSFNVRGEPIVGTPEDAFRCFMGSGIESLFVEGCYLRKEDQDPALAGDYTSAFEPD